MSFLGAYDHWAGSKKKWFKEMYLTVRMFLYVMNTHNTCTFHVIGNFKAKQTCALYNISLPSWQNANILTIPGFYVVDILKSSLIIRNVAHVTAVCIFSYIDFIISWILTSKVKTLYIYMYSNCNIHLTIDLLLLRCI